VARKKNGADLLSSFLEREGLSLRVFAEHVECSKSLVGALKNGNAKPGRSLAVRIADITGQEVPVAAWDR